MTKATHKVFLFSLLAMITIVWGVAWPVCKYGLNFMPAIWFAEYRIIFALICMFMLAVFFKQLKFPKKSDWLLIIIIGVFQVGLFLIAMTIGLKYVGAGRSSVLVYTTPIWVTPIAYFFFDEKVPFLKFIGILLSMLGVIILFSPLSLNWHDPHIVLGNSLLILAAIFWAVAMIAARQLPWKSTPFQIAPWQFIVALIPTTIVCLWLDPHPVIVWNSALWFSLLFASILGTAFAYWGMVLVSKELPTVTISLILLGVPLVSIISSAIFLNEKITESESIAIVLILVGLACAASATRKQRSVSRKL